MKEIIHTQNAPAPIGPYSQAIKAGSFIFSSGQIAINPSNGEMVIDSVINETKQVMENISALLRVSNLMFSDIVSTTIYLQRMSDFSAVNEIYGSYFASEFPARTTIQVAGLPKNANVEISFIAQIKSVD